MLKLRSFIDFDGEVTIFVMIIKTPVINKNTWRSCKHGKRD